MVWALLGDNYSSNEATSSHCLSIDSWEHLAQEIENKHWILNPIHNSRVERQKLIEIDLIKWGSEIYHTSIWNRMDSKF